MIEGSKVLAAVNRCTTNHVVMADISQIDGELPRDSHTSGHRSRVNRTRSVSNVEKGDMASSYSIESMYYES